MIRVYFEGGGHALITKNSEFYFGAVTLRKIKDSLLHHCTF